MPAKPEKVFGSDPNIINGVLQAGSNTLLVDNQAVETAAVSLVTDIKYYWQITAIFSDGAASEVSRVFIFDTDNVVPIADAGADVETWLIGGTRDVQLAGASIDPDGPAAIFLWEVTASPDPGTASLDDPALANATVTVIAAGSYTLSLVVDDSEDTSAPDTMTITVYSDACAHAQAQPGYVAPDGDTNGDCVVDMLDLANVASDWLEDTSTQP